MMKKIMISVLSFNLLYGGVGKDMTNFFNRFGAVTNSTKGSAFHDQQGGYYNGGSFFMRSPTRNTNPISVTPPGFRMGCGGIDIWAGGLSFINAQQLKEMLKSVVSNGVNYAFMLAVETYAPQVHNIMQQLNKLAADFNQLNINSCEAAAGLVGSVWPKSDLGSQSACRMMSSHDGRTVDWAKARHDCGSNPEPILNRANPEQLVGEFNLAWIALEKINLDLGQKNETMMNVFENDEGLNNDECVTLKELFMTFSGTIVRKNENGKMIKKVYPALGDRDSFLKAMMSGGNVTVYHCVDKGKCLNLEKRTIHIPPQTALQPKITNILETLAEKIQNDDGQQIQTPAEISLINATSLPLYKFINVTTAYQKGRAPISIGEYSEIIALDVVITYVNDVLMLVREATSDIKDVQFTDEDIEPFLMEIRKTQQALYGVRQNVMQKFDQLLGFIQKTQMIESQLHHMMGSVSEMR